MKAVKRAFDKKFGAEYVAGLPTSPGVYRVYDESDRLVYVGKAKNLRRRLSQYRNAKRCKKHRKMRKIVKDAHRIEHELCADDLAACLLETRLIQSHRPRWNVASAFSFLYPMIGMRQEDGLLAFCYTTTPEMFADFEFHGAYRSREITGEAFFGLMKLLAFVGHPMPWSRGKQVKYSYVFAFRQLPADWLASWNEFWKGESLSAVESLVLALCENAGARRGKRDIQDRLDAIKRFWKHEASALKSARKHSGFADYPVPQADRDPMFLRARSNRPAPKPRGTRSRSA